MGKVKVQCEILSAHGWVPRTLKWKHFNRLLTTLTQRYFWVLSIFSWLFLFKWNKPNHDVVTVNDSAWGCMEPKNTFYTSAVNTLRLFSNIKLCTNIYWEHWLMLNMFTLISLVNKTFANIKYPRSPVLILYWYSSQSKFNI